MTGKAEEQLESRSYEAHNDFILGHDHVLEATGTIEDENSVIQTKNESVHVPNGETHRINSTNTNNQRRNPVSSPVDEQKYNLNRNGAQNPVTAQERHETKTAH